MGCNAAESRELGWKMKRRYQNHWEHVVEYLNEDLWGTAYSTATEQFYGMELRPTQKLEIANYPFPGRPLASIEMAVLHVVEIFTIGELREAVSNIKNRKVPVLDNIPPEVMKELARIHLLLRAQEFSLRGRKQTID
ncbi:hypothetical protein JTB14_011677 [Gonioctena quinquepunctata]|nr:hypothetical protein JTB14_011677 [Gonioctena quinquepunctata]